MEARPTPITVADSAALRIFNQAEHFGPHPDDNQILDELNLAASEQSFYGTSFQVETSRGFAVPARFFIDEGPFQMVNFFKLAFEGKLACYAKLALNKPTGEDSVRALCLGFTDVTLLPSRDPMPNHMLLFTPVLSVDTIDPTD